MSKKSWYAFVTAHPKAICVFTGFAWKAPAIGLAHDGRTNSPTIRLITSDSRRCVAMSLRLENGGRCARSIQEERKDHGRHRAARHRHQQPFRGIAVGRSWPLRHGDCSPVLGFPRRPPGALQRDGLGGCQLGRTFDPSNSRAIHKVSPAAFIEGVCRHADPIHSRRRTALPR